MWRVKQTMRGPRLLSSAGLFAPDGARRNGMLKLTIATIFVASLAGAGAAVACMEPREDVARPAQRFTQHEAPNHRHLLRHREALRGG
jgi:hypothetical protein